MRRLIIPLLVVFAVACSSAPASEEQQAGASVEEKGGVGRVFGEYRTPDPKWPAWAHPYPREGYIWGSQGGVFAESPNKIWLANRGELKLPDRLPPPLPGLGISGPFPGYWGALGTMAANEAIDDMRNSVVAVDGEGKLITSFTQWDKLFEFGRGPHHIHISPYDPERHVWVIDDLRHAIFKFTNDGTKLVQTLGVPGEITDNEDLTHFRRPTAMDWFPDGSFVVSDGYSNTRVVKFDKDGKPLMKWGSPGKGPGQFSTPHGIAVSGKGDRVYVSDRGNNRIQVFDANGTFLDEWPNIRANSLAMTADDQYVWAVDIGLDRVVQFDLNGRVRDSWGQFGVRPGYTWCPHQMSADSDGNLYIAECFNGRTQKFVPKPGADPTKLFRGRPMAGPSGT